MEFKHQKQEELKVANLLEKLKGLWSDLLKLKDSELAHLKELTDELGTRRGRLFAILLIGNLALFRMSHGLLWVLSLLGCLLMVGHLLVSLREEDLSKLPPVPVTPPPAPTDTTKPTV